MLERRMRVGYVPQEDVLPGLIVPFVGVDVVFTSIPFSNHASKKMIPTSNIHCQGASCISCIIKRPK